MRWVIRLLEQLPGAAIEHPTRGRLTASIGVATLSAGEDADAWRHRADRGLYAAKAAGRATTREAIAQSASERSGHRFA
ncbi:diguanylate cyclase [Kaistia dalseonensis]|uniref:PleD family two-component response regulator n=1 Tax=Kaistia dalseonensis TaxID=410840 RepID=A0ABU0H953_9HYPH|nr:diguanylate cyclase [Kaistia dalseonensis]MCX5496231.1 diguanylate cyclase [Kaistia dalseonensis]MDQ0438848.1 PleD family two-component response regulator [Kaistia dalseonensis]